MMAYRFHAEAEAEFEEAIAYYAIESDTIFILAVMHLHRSPAYWMHRSP